MRAPRRALRSGTPMIPFPPAMALAPRISAGSTAQTDGCCARAIVGNPWSRSRSGASLAGRLRRRAPHGTPFRRRRRDLRRPASWMRTRCGLTWRTERPGSRRRGAPVRPPWTTDDMRGFRGCQGWSGQVCVYPYAAIFRGSEKWCVRAPESWAGAATRPREGTATALPVRDGQARRIVRVGGVIVASVTQNGRPGIQGGRAVNGTSWGCEEPRPTSDRGSTCSPLWADHRRRRVHLQRSARRSRRCSGR